MLSTLPLTFVTIVDSGSITRAADELSLAKSAVSQNLKRLEQQLDIKLATRSTRRFSLTPAGERYYQRCKEVLMLSKLAETELEAYGSKPSCPFTITAPHALIAPVIAPAMTTVSRRFPDLEPVIIAEDKRLDLIASGIDVSITVGTLPDSTLRARRVGELRDILCVAPPVLASAPSVEDPGFAQWVQSVPYIAHMREPATVEHHLPLNNNKNPIRLKFKPRLRSNTIDGVTAFVRNGLGIALLPDISIADDLKSGHLANISATPAPAPTPVYAVHAYDSLAPRSVQETIDAIKQAFERITL